MTSHHVAVGWLTNVSENLRDRRCKPGSVLKLFDTLEGSKGKDKAIPETGCEGP
jgi:hypothetical protein